MRIAGKELYTLAVLRKMPVELSSILGKCIHKPARQIAGNNLRIRRGGAAPQIKRASFISPYLTDDFGAHFADNLVERLNFTGGLLGRNARIFSASFKPQDNFKRILIPAFFFCLF